MFSFGALVQGCRRLDVVSVVEASSGCYAVQDFGGDPSFQKQSHVQGMPAGFRR